MFPVVTFERNNSAICGYVVLQSTKSERIRIPLDRNRKLKVNFMSIMTIKKTFCL